MLKILKYAFLFSILISSCVFADAQVSSIQNAVHIIDRSVEEKKDNLPVVGKIPQVHFVQFDQLLEESINSKIRENYEARLNFAIMSRAEKVTFNYKILHDGNYLSLIVETETVGPETRQFFDIVNVDTEAKKMIHINDVLGPNGVRMANRVINMEIALEPGKYISDFSGITNEHNFYLENNHLYIVFNRDEIIQDKDFHSVSINIANVINFNMPLTMYKTDETAYNLKMIPLRAVLETFGFTPKWIGSTQTVEIERGDSFYSSMRINENLYFRNTSPKRLLEAAPVLLNGNVYVPISYFEEFLLLFYTIDSDGTITFSEYK